MAPECSVGRSLVGIASVGIHNDPVETVPVMPTNLLCHQSTHHRHCYNAILTVFIILAVMQCHTNMSVHAHFFDLQEHAYEE